ncbi:MAG: methionine--tRNA ligase [Spirochaetes bacterium]|nr:methionine--tRNA ligase [Spirochaetota bacterium]
MSLNKRDFFYITTPIYYINDEPHVGHYYTTTTADILARYHRLIGDDVFFVTGTDENSQKVLQAAEKASMDPVQFTDIMAKKWEKTWKKLNISFDFFIRTTSKEHIQSVEKLLKQCHEKGDIYKKEYEGLYCIGCEKFLTDSDLVDGICPDHKTKPQLLKEENYFFRLSKYQDQLMELMRSGDFALPEARRNEMIEFIKNQLQDISISRATVKWGIPLSIDPTHVVYVWFDALINYISALGYHEDNKKMSQFWPVAIHLVGKDIYRFHTIMWPAMLLSAGVKPPKQVFGHGFFTINGEKISKSLGNVIDPVSLSEKYGIDTIRYFIMREIPFGKDSDFSIPRLEQRYKGDLADDLGNLINRSTNMLNKFSQGMIPEPDKEWHKNDKKSTKVQKDGENLLNFLDKGYARFEFSQILEALWNYIKSINKYIDDTKPWVLKKENRGKELETVLYNIMQSISLICLFLYPIMPIIAQKIYDQINQGEIHKEKYLEKTKWFSLPTKTSVKKGEILFPPLD